MAPYASTVAREAAEGHAIGDHSWSHLDLTTLSAADRNQDLAGTDQAIMNAGAPQPTMMRPPYGAQNADVMQSLANRYEAGVFWSIDTQDWKNLNVEKTTARALQAKQGSIILMHDIHPTTVDAVPGIIDGLRAKGLTLVTVPELFGGDMTQYAGMQVYSQYNVR